jgi:hypothetical protein
MEKKSTIELAKELGNTPANQATLRQLYTAAIITGMLAEHERYKEYPGIAIEIAEKMLVSEVEKGYYPVKE